MNGWVYSAGVGAYYRLTGGGLLLGQQLSVLAVVLSATSLVRIMGMVAVRPRRRRWVLALVLFLPAGIVYTSGTMREAFQQLFFVLTVELSLRLMRRTTARTVVALAAVVVLGASLHGALAAAGWAVAMTAALFVCVCATVSGRRPERSPATC